MKNICRNIVNVKATNKLHNMKALFILSHHDHHFSHLLVFMKKRTFVGPC